MKPGEIGNALTCAPYVTLARDAVPSEGFPSLNRISLSQWLDDMNFDSLVNPSKNINNNFLKQNYSRRSYYE